MSQATPATLGSIDVVGTLRQHPGRLIVPAVLIFAVALAFAVVRPDTWEASQALIVRDEAAGSTRLTKPTHGEEVKSTQETLLELVKSRGVVGQALREVGPLAGCKVPALWPTAKDIEAIQDSVKLSPPKGAEFGKTDVFYLKVQDRDHDRSIALTSAVCKQMQIRFEDLLAAKAKSQTAELLRTVTLAQADLDESTKALTAVEERVGTDLAELRILNELPSGNSDLHHTATQIDTDLRGYYAAKSSNEELLKLLSESTDDPGRLLATPSRLLESQPALRRLKDGLVDAQLHTATLRGTLAASHPAVLAAKAGEEEISQRLHNEIAVAIKGVEVDLRLTNERIQSLEEQRASVQSRLGKLASARADYANLVNATRHRGEILRTAQLELSASRASEAAAHTASLITVVDRPDAGTGPVGASRASIALAGLLGGLLTGVGLVFITARPLSVDSVVVPRTAGKTPVWVGPIANLGPSLSLTFKQALNKLIGGEPSRN